MNKRISLMFHDVINDLYSFSGFKTIGARQYEITEKKLIDILKFVDNINRDVVFTFDDGGSSFYYIIAPLLEKYNKRGVFFISTDFIGSESFLTSEQIKELHSRGHIIASHSHTHPRDISKLSITEILSEWEQSREILESITGDSIKIASIPQGASSKSVLRMLKKAGYSEVYTSKPSTSIVYKDGLAVYGRFAITRNTSEAQIKKILCSDFYKKQLVSKYYILRFCKLILGSKYNRLKTIYLIFRK